MNKFTIKYSSVRKLAELYDIFLFDLDGVCWHGDNGHIGESFRNIEWLES
jgi:ribonucleotide monophosphatase NagD (HAD superfamily)